jgi:sterol desaturase/sphingolipid hydroxylase (fatty acid hydroxylase superfamily)
MRFRYTSPRIIDGALYGLVTSAVLVWSSLAGAPAGWERVVTLVPPAACFVLGLWGLHVGTHALGCGAFVALERWLPAVIAPHRIQPGARVAEPKDLWRVVLVNQLVAMPLTLALGWLLLHARGWSLVAPLPGPGRILLELAGLALFTEVTFWSAHRVLHLRWWFRRVHHVHHRFRATRPIAATYMHPFEYVVGNIAPMVLGVVVLDAHFLSACLLTVLATLNIVITHSGLHLPGLPWAVHHDWHHYKARGCYGALYLLDRCTGADKELLAWGRRQDGRVPPPAS